MLRQHQVLCCVVRDLGLNLVLNKISTDDSVWWLQRRSKFGPLKEPMGEIALTAGLWGLSGGANCLMQSLCQGEARRTGIWTSHSLGAQSTKIAFFDLMGVVTR